MQIRIGTLVTWGDPHSEDYDMTGIVTKTWRDILDEYYLFTVLWADNSTVQYNEFSIRPNAIKVVIF